MRPLLFILIASIGAAAEYFPPVSLGSTERSHTFKAQWYSSQLAALEEEPIYASELPKKRECYRFTWLRTFHHPVALRLEVDESGSGKFFVKVADGKGGYKPGKLVRSETQDLGSHVVREIRADFESQKFFDLPSYENSIRREKAGTITIGTDGAVWIVEALVDGRYHLVTRWSPETGAIHDIGRKFIALGGDFTPIY